MRTGRGQSLARGQVPDRSPARSGSLRSWTGVLGSGWSVVSLTVWSAPPSPLPDSPLPEAATGEVGPLPLQAPTCVVEAHGTPLRRCVCVRRCTPWGFDSGSSVVSGGSGPTSSCRDTGWRCSLTAATGTTVPSTARGSFGVRTRTDGAQRSRPTRVAIWRPTRRWRLQGGGWFGCGSARRAPMSSRRPDGLPQLPAPTVPVMTEPTDTTARAGSHHSRTRRWCSG